MHKLLIDGSGHYLVIDGSSHELRIDNAAPAAGVAPTSIFYGPFVGPLGGPL